MGIWISKNTIMAAVETRLYRSCFQQRHLVVEKGKGRQRLRMDLTVSLFTLIFQSRTGLFDLFYFSQEEREIGELRVLLIMSEVP